MLAQYGLSSLENSGVVYKTVQPALQVPCANFHEGLKTRSDLNGVKGHTIGDAGDGKRYIVRPFSSSNGADIIIEYEHPRVVPE